MTIAMDFDGVIHKYRDGWLDGEIYDELNLKILDLMKELMDRGCSVVIVTTRDRKQVKKHFDMLNDVPAPDLIPFRYKTLPLWTKFYNKLGVVGITNRKVAAHVTIDDRAIRFDAKRKKRLTADSLINFKPFKYYGKARKK